MTRPRIPRQSDIARLAGVSQATVSMVLNDRAGANRIPEATQARIREAMAELGYVPNIAAQSLRGGRSGLIGVHTFERVFPTAPDDYYREFLNGIEERAVESGLDLVLFASTRKPDGTRSIYGTGSNRMRLADGAIILGFEKNDDEIARLAGEGFPFVFIGHREVEGVVIPFVTADYAAAMGPVVGMLEAAGHRRVTYLAAPLRGFAQRERLDGFEAAASTAFDYAVDVRDETEVTADWVGAQLAAGSTALVAETFDLARALRTALDTAGLDAPRDVSVISLDSDPRGDGPFSHVRVPRREMGRRAVELLLAVIDGEADLADTGSGTLRSRAEPVHCEPPGPDTVGPPPVRRSSPAVAQTG